MSLLSKRATEWKPFYTYLSLKQRIDCSELFDLAKLGEGNIVVL